MYRFAACAAFFALSGPGLADELAGVRVLGPAASATDAWRASPARVISLDPAASAQVSVVRGPRTSPAPDWVPATGHTGNLPVLSLDGCAPETALAVEDANLF
jgi:hypothetical protein